jgi:hypothetical protein
MIERRTQRSDAPDVALTLLLESVARSRAIPALALVSESGRLLAGAGADLHALTAVASVAHGAAAGEDGIAWEAATGGEDLYARTVDVRGQRYLLASVGAPIRRARDAEASIRRILSA